MKVRRKMVLFQCTHWVLVFGGAFFSFQLTFLFSRTYNGGQHRRRFLFLLYLYCLA